MLVFVCLCVVTTHSCGVNLFPFYRLAVRLIAANVCAITISVSMKTHVCVQRCALKKATAVISKMVAFKLTQQKQKSF